MAKTPSEGDSTPTTKTSSPAPSIPSPEPPADVAPAAEEANPADADAPPPRDPAAEVPVAAEGEPPASTDSPEPEPPTATWEDLGLPEPLHKAVLQMGWTSPAKVQAATFEPVTRGQDVLVESHTGSGKTGAFCLPWLAGRFVADDPKTTGVQLLVLTPTRELAKQVCDELARLAQHSPVRSLPIYGGTAMQPQFDALREGVHAVVGTPGRLLDHIRRRSLDLSHVNMVVLDEADEMLSMGFLEDIRAILEACSSEHQTTLFSATIPREIERISKRYMKDAQQIRLTGDHASALEIEHVFYSVGGAIKTRDLIDIIELEEPSAAIVFCNTREQTNFVASFMAREGYPAEPLSSDLSQAARERVMGGMREGRIRFLVATDVAARGIDISHVSHVINYAFPENPESYVHRTGRTGRAGRAGLAISLLGPQDLGNFYQLKLHYPSISFTERALPPAEVLAEQRKEAKIDRISQRFPEQVTPEWTLLARHLISDPRGERIVAVLLERALRESAPSRPRLADPREEDERGRGPRREPGGEGRRRGRHRDEDDRRGRRGRREEGERRGRRGRGDRHREERTEGPEPTEGEIRGRRRGRRHERDEIAAEAEPVAEIDDTAAEAGDATEAQTNEVHEADATPAQATAPTPSEGAPEGEDGDEPRKRRRRRRRRRRGPRPEGEAAEAADETREGAPEGVETEPREAGAPATEEPEAAEAEPSAQATGDADTPSDEPGRRRRRRRRRRRGGGQPPEGEAEAAAPQGTTNEAAEAKEAAESEEDGAPRGRRRRRRRRKPVEPTPVASRSQDEIVIDIDEEELKVVRDEFGEIDELDELTLKGRRRAVMDSLQEEVELEDVSEEDLEEAAEEEEEAAAEGEAAEEEAAEEGEAAATQEAAGGAGAGDTSTPPTETATEETGEAPRRKRRRRRRRKKKAPPPDPELMVPPHKDFWEAWATRFTFTEFEDEVWNQRHGIEAEPEPEPAPEPAPRPERSPVAEFRAPDEPLVKVRLNVGRTHGKKAAHVRALLAERLDLAGRAIRDLTVREGSTVFRVPASSHARLLDHLDGSEWGELLLRVTLPDGMPAGTLEPSATEDPGQGPIDSSATADATPPPTEPTPPPATQGASPEPPAAPEAAASTTAATEAAEAGASPDAPPTAG